VEGGETLGLVAEIATRSRVEPAQVHGELVARSLRAAGDLADGDAEIFAIDPLRVRAMRPQPPLALCTAETGGEQPVFGRRDDADRAVR
jgi:hypothetical protein